RATTSGSGPEGRCRIRCLPACAPSCFTRPCPSKSDPPLPRDGGEGRGEGVGTPRTDDHLGHDEGMSRSMNTTIETTFHLTISALASSPEAGDSARTGPPPPSRGGGGEGAR